MSLIYKMYKNKKGYVDFTVNRIKDGFSRNILIIERKKGGENNN